MGIKDTHRDYIIERLYIKYLKEGIIPTPDMITAGLAEYLEEHPNLESPASKAVDLSIGRGESSSAGLIQKASELFSSDIAIVTKEIFKTTRDNEQFYNRWSEEIGRLNNKARELEDRIDGLLLLAYGTEGYFANVGDIFSDMNKVNTDDTTAKVDINEAAVTINPEKTLTDGSLGTRLDLSLVTENDVAFIPMSTTSSPNYTSIGENVLSNIFKTNSAEWVSLVTTNKNAELICELKIRFSSDKDLKFSKILMDYAGASSSDSATVTALYSKNGYEWSLVQTAEATKVLGLRNITWSFPETEGRWLKFIFRKPSADSPIDTKWQYEFKIKNIKLFAHNYSSDSGGNIFEGKSLSAKDLNDEAVFFSTVALEACEELPELTNIEYSVAASKDDSEWTEWTRIEPVEKEDTILPKVINFGGVDWSENIDDNILGFDTTLTGVDARLKLTTTFDNTVELDGLLGYKFKKVDEFAAVNSAILGPPDTNVDLINDSISMWRNVRNKDIFESSDSYPDTLTVRQTPRGWGKTGAEYSCYFEIKDSDGRRINFGSTMCIIDGSVVSGNTVIPKGIHKFKTEASNWFDISANIIEHNETILTEETLQSLDPLYPLNHKLLIEGFPYALLFDGDKKYTGTDLSAEFYCTKVSLFELENNIPNNLGYFATRGVGSSGTKTAISTMVRYDPTLTDYGNELFITRWKTSEEEVRYKYVKLKALLTAEKDGITPLLYSYRLKLGV